MTTSGNSSYPQKIKYTLKQTKIPKTYQEIVKIFSLFKFILIEAFRDVQCWLREDL